MLEKYDKYYLKTEKCPSTYIPPKKRNVSRGTVTIQHFDFAQTRTQKRGNANTKTHSMKANVIS